MVMDRVKGKVALVTGAVQGIGFGIARILLQSGAKVCLADINVQKGADVAQLLQQEFGQDSAIFIKCDVTCQTDFADAFLKTKQAFGGLDIVCNNAGMANEKEWKMVVDLNLTAVIRGTMLAVDHMGVDEGGKGGVVVNTASILGLVDVASCMPVYCATKHGVVAFTRSMAANKWFTDKGLRLNCLCPNMVESPLQDIFNEEGTFYGGQDALDKVVKDFGPPMPVSRVADAFLKLVEDSKLNGAAMVVRDGVTELSEARK